MELKARGLSLLLVSAITFGVVLSVSVGGAAQTQAAVLYVDGSLQSTTCSTYSIQSRNCSGSDGSGFNTIQAAVNAMAAGDTVNIRGGTYSYSPNTGVTLSRACSSSAKCTIQGYQNELVILSGSANYPAFDQDNNRDGFADGSGTKDRQKLVNITSSFWVVRKLVLNNSGWDGMWISPNANDNLVDEVIVRNSWRVGLLMFGNRNTIQFSAFHNNRHSGGLTIWADTFSSANNNTLYRNISYKNGRDGNDAQVLPADIDPAGGCPTCGGGNSDGFNGFKGCATNAPSANDNLCRGTLVKENIAWKNTDDCFDFSVGSSWIIGNIANDCGPEGSRGFKHFAGVQNMVYSGNISYKVQERGYEPQIGLSTGAVWIETNNAAIRDASTGFRWVTNGSGGTLYCKNLLGAYAGNGSGTNFNFSGGCNPWDLSGPGTPNWDSSTQGSPGLVNDNFTPNYVAAENDAGFPGTSIQSRWRAVWNQFESNLRPASSSRLIDGGVVIPGYHCPTADDKGQDPNAACRHWMGAAPDIGPFESDIAGNPDKNGAPVLMGTPRAPSGLTVR